MPLLLELENDDYDTLCLMDHLTQVILTHTHTHRTRGSLTYVDVTWETCAAAEPDQQQGEREEDRGDREALQPHVSSSSSTDGRRGTTGVIPSTPGPVPTQITDSHIHRRPLYVRSLCPPVPRHTSRTERGALQPRRV